MKKAIVTGGTGFIGSWLIKELLNNDYFVTAIVRNKNKLLPEFIKNPKFSILEKSLDELNRRIELPNETYDVIFHIAWSGVSSEEKNNLTLQLHNIEIAMNTMEFAKKIKVQKFISIGSVSEYAYSTNTIDTNKRQTPNDMYGAAKASAYYFLTVKANQIGMPFIWVMLPSTYGGRRTSDKNILTYTITTLLKHEKPLYGNLKQMWDFLYVSDVAKAIRLIGEKGRFGKIYGVGSGIYRPLRYYIETVRDIINPSLPLGIGELPSMSNKSYSSCVDIYELIKDTGFKPEISFKEAE